MKEAADTDVVHQEVILYRAFTGLESHLIDPARDIHNVYSLHRGRHTIIQSST